MSKNKKKYRHHQSTIDTVVLDMKQFAKKVIQYESQFEEDDYVDTPEHRELYDKVFDVVKYLVDNAFRSDRI